MYVDVKVITWQRIELSDHPAEEIAKMMDESPLGNELFNLEGATLETLPEAESICPDENGNPQWEICDDKGNTLIDSKSYFARK